MKTNLVSLADACRWIESHGTGQRPHTSTLTRWIARGSRGRKLPAVRAGGGRFYVSLDDVAAFIEYRNTAAAPGDSMPAIATARHDLEMQQLDRMLGLEPETTDNAAGTSPAVPAGTAAGRCG